MSRKRTRREVYRLALHYAITERDGYAGAWEAGSPERARATLWEIERRHKEDRP